MNLFLWQNCSSVPPDSGNGPTIHPVAQVQKLPLIYYFLLILHPFSHYVLLILPLTFLSNSSPSLHFHCHHPPLSHHPLPPWRVQQPCHWASSNSTLALYIPIDIRDILKKVCDLWFPTALLKITKVANARSGHSLILYHWVAVTRAFFLFSPIAKFLRVSGFSHMLFSLPGKSSSVRSQVKWWAEFQGLQDSHLPSGHILNNQLFLSVGRTCEYEGIALLWWGYWLVGFELTKREITLT